MFHSVGLNVIAPRESKSDVLDRSRKALGDMPAKVAVEGRPTGRGQITRQQFDIVPSENLRTIFFFCTTFRNCVYPWSVVGGHSAAWVIYWSRVRIGTAGTVPAARLLTLTTSTALPATAETHLHEADSLVLTADTNPSRLGIPSSQDLQLPVSEAPSHDVFPNPPFNLL